GCSEAHAGAGRCVCKGAYAGYTEGQGAVSHARPVGLPEDRLRCAGADQDVTFSGNGKKKNIRFLFVPECIDRVEICRLPRRIHTTENTDDDPKPYTLNNRQHARHGKEVLSGTEHQGAYRVPGKDTETSPDHASRDTDDGSLIDEHAHHLFFLGADAAHDPNLL